CCSPISPPTTSSATSRACGAPRNSCESCSASAPTTTTCPRRRSEDGGVTAAARTGFFGAALGVAALAALAGTSLPAAAQSVGVVAPLSEALAPLGEQLRIGAEIAAAQRGLAASRLIVADDACTAEGGRRA